MCSELECGVCFMVFNAGRRCPRLLRCHHGFCESCLLALSQPGGPEPEPEPARSIVCPLCRQITTFSGVGNVRAELRVDECVLEQLLAANVLFLDPEEEGWEVPDEDEDDGDATPPRRSAEDRDSSEEPSGGRIRRSWMKVWKKISGKRTPRRGRFNMTNDDMRNLAMMSCYMF